MKSILRNFRRGLIVLVVMIPMVAGIVLLDLFNSKNGNAALRASADAEREAFNGRDSNWIDGTGFDESKVTGGIGATLAEPDWASMDRWDSIYDGMTFWDLLNSINPSYENPITENTSPLEGDFRINSKNSTNQSTRGKSADNPWIISNAQELAFLSKLITLGTSSYTNIKPNAIEDLNKDLEENIIWGYPVVNNQVYALFAYISAPYFQLASDGDFDLGEKRWVAPYFTYTSNETVNNWANRFYLDGNGATIKNAFVRQSNATGVSLPSILGNLPYKSQVKNLKIENAYVTHAETVCPASIVSQTLGVSSSSWYSTTTSSIFSNINVTNSVVRGGTSTTNMGSVNGITGNAAVISDCTVDNTTFIISSPPATGATGSHARGIGTACEFIGNTVKNSSLEIVNPNYSNSWSLGIGALVNPNNYVKGLTFEVVDAGDTSTYGGVFSDGTPPKYTSSAQTVLVINGTKTHPETPGYGSPIEYLGFEYALNKYVDEDNEDEILNYWDNDAMLKSTFAFEGGFYDNTVSDSKMTVTANGGTTSNYGHASGIGYSNVNTQQNYENNKVENSLISVKTDDNNATGVVHAAGILYSSFTATAELGQHMKLTDNSVLNSTISADTQMSITNASGISILETATMQARITECYTENTNVISQDRSNITNVNLESRASGINVGFAELIENCVVGSGNIVAKSSRSRVYAYGIGSTLGHTTYGPTGTSGRQYFYCETKGEYYQHANDHDAGCSTLTKEEYIGNLPQTKINNCFNFSNITTNSTGTVYAAGIGMAEGFNGCINYGNVIGNWVGGIALGFEYTTNNQPTTPTAASDFASTSTTVNGAIRPLIIKNCANYGNLIKVGNEIVSHMGGIFAIYNNSLNYQRKNIGKDGISDIEIISEDINGKHVEVTNCVSAGKFFFYYLVDGTYVLTREITNVPAGNLRLGMIFGTLQMTAQPISSMTEETFNSDFSKRFVIQDNFYVENRFEIGGADGLQSNVTTKTQATRVRKMPLNHAYNSTAPNQPNAKEDELTVEFDGTQTATNYITNKTNFTYWSQTPAANVFSNVLGGATSSGRFDGSSYSTVATTAYEQAYNNIAANWTNNKSISSAYARLEYETGSTIAAADRWDVSSKTPQLKNKEYPFQILAYDRNNAAQGYAPNVSIVKLTTQDQKYGNTAIEFNISEFMNPMTGESVEQWYRHAGASQIPVKPNSLVTIQDGLKRIDELPVIMLFAHAKPTVFKITYEETDEYSGAITNTNAEVEITQSIKINATYTPNGPVNVSAVIWMVENKFGVWEEFFTEIFEDLVGLKGVDVEGEPQPTELMRSLNFRVDDIFIVKYAQGTLGNYSFNIKAVFVSIGICEITLSIPTATEGIANQLRMGLELKPSTTESVRVVEGSIVQLEAVFDEALYVFKKFVVNGVVDSYEILSEDGVESPFMTIQILKNISISFELEAREYEINISMYYLTSNDIRMPLAKNDEMIKSGVKFASIDYDQDRVLEVINFYKDGDANCYYRFERWEYVYDAYNSISDTNLLSLKNIGTNVLKSSSRIVNAEPVFEIVAIFVRQVEIFVSMEREGFEYYNNAFTIFKNYEENYIETFDASSGSLIVDDYTQLRIEFFPDTRLKILEVKIDGLNIPLKHVPDDVLILQIINMCNVDVFLGPRPATINVFTKIAHESTGKEYSMGFITLTGSIVGDVGENENSLADYNYKINNDRTLNVAFDRTKLGNDYRLDKIGIKYANGNTYYEYLNNDLKATNDNFSHVMNSNFFKNFVDKEGVCQIWLFLVATYEVDLTVSAKTANDFEREDGTYKYKYSDNIGNWFELEFGYYDAYDVWHAWDFIAKPDSIREINGKFIIDNGVIVKYKYGNGKYSTFDRVSGLNQEQNDAKEVKITSLQSLDFIFLMNQYTLKITQIGGGKASVNSYNEMFELNSVITISLDVNSMYQISSINFGSYSLSDLGAIRNGNSVTIKATPAFIQTIGAIANPDVELNINVSTGVSTMVLAGGGGGGALVIILIALAIFLVIRSKRIAEARKIAEAKVREYEQKFNIGGMIAKLREDPDAYEASMKNPKAKSPTAPAPAAALTTLDGGSLLKDKSLVDKNKRKIGSLKADGTIIDIKGNPFGKINLETGAITDNENNVLGIVQGDGSIKK